MLDSRLPATVASHDAHGCCAAILEREERGEGRGEGKGKGRGESRR